MNQDQLRITLNQKIKYGNLSLIKTKFMQAGSYVICIDDSNWDASAFILMSGLPEKGKIYRVRRVIPNIDIDCIEDGIALDGIHGDWRIFDTYYNTKVFEEVHFRMSQFREIVNPILIEEVLEHEAVFCEC